MINRKITFLGTKLKAVEYLNTEIFELTNTGSYELPFETSPTKGEKHDCNTCQTCITNHKKILFDVTNEYNGKGFRKAFPNCCVQHSLLIHLPLFKKNDYDVVPKMVADKVIFTMNHIENNIGDENFYNEITDYIEYTTTSFGQLPVESEPLFLSTYIQHITHFLEMNNSKNGNFRIILDFVKQNYSKAKPKNIENQESLEILLRTYENWIKIFPFEISFFSNFKSQFEKQMPILSGEFHYNKYLGISKGKLHTKSSLINFLMNLTKNLLDKVNIPNLRRQGLIADMQATQLEFAEAELNTKTAEITKQFSRGESQYVNTLKKWLEFHKDYFKEVSSLLKDLPPQQNSNKFKETIGYFSQPDDFNAHDNWEIQKSKCQRHNEAIYRKYEENLENGKNQLSNLVLKMLEATTETKKNVEYDLLERQFNQMRSIFSISLNSEVDRGCVIEGTENSDIESKFYELKKFHEKSITDVDIHLKTIEGFRKRDIKNNNVDDQSYKEDIRLETELFSKVESAFSFMQNNDPRKHKRILSDDDFDSLVKWVNHYFENDFAIPEIDVPIKIINTNKGNVVYTFIKIFKELHPTKTKPDSLFELIKACFYIYRNDSINNFKKQKEPQFYSQLVNKK